MSKLNCAWSRPCVMHSGVRTETGKAQGNKANKDKAQGQSQSACVVSSVAHRATQMMSKVATSDKGGPPFGWREEINWRWASGKMEVVRVRHGLLVVEILSDEGMMKDEVRWAGS